MIPPRFVPHSILQLYEVKTDGSRILLQELPGSTKNRMKLHNMRNDLLMVDSTKKLLLVENNAI